MTFKNYYKVLGIKDFSNAEEIKKAYRALAHRYHPDHNAGGRSGAERFSQINEAYQALKDPMKRRHHDAALRTRNSYAPAYPFYRQYTPAAVNEPEEPVPDGMKTEPKGVAKGWIKLLILIVITSALMFAVFSPSGWISNIFGNK